VASFAVGAIRTVVSAVWVYEGSWKKVLARAPEEAAIVASVPGLSARAARTATLALGIGETVLAAWVLSGRRPRACAIVQTGLVVGMNAGGLAVGRRHIARPVRLVVRNAGFLALVWAGSASR
jgi:uncharacterized membrane protein YphA (DoxX/SURF4 family)